jgi:hypothetical protein
MKADKDREHTGLLCSKHVPPPKRQCMKHVRDSITTLLSDLRIPTGRDTRQAATASANVHVAMEAEDQRDLIHHACFLAKSSLEGCMRQQTDLWIRALDFESAKTSCLGVLLAILV